jgi:hypothetical protein
LRVPKVINNVPEGGYAGPSSHFDLLNMTENSRAKQFEKSELEVTTIF